MIVLSCIRSGRTIGATTGRKNRARCEEKVLLVADASPSRLRWHARAVERRMRGAKRSVSLIGGKRGEHQRGCTKALLWPHIGPERVAPDIRRRTSLVESRSREPMRRRLTVRSAYSRTCALAIVKRKIASRDAPGSPGFEIARVFVERRAAEIAVGDPWAFEKPVFSSLDYDGNRCSNVITTPRSRMQTWYHGAAI